MSDSISAAQVIRSRRMDSSSPARTSGSSAASASRSASRGTTMSVWRTPSKRSPYSRIASTPRSRTSSQIGRTTCSAASTSKSARGTRVR